jgi:branched-chain amino acid transport system substrate-binding protein
MAIPPSRSHPILAGRRWPTPRAIALGMTAVMAMALLAAACGGGENVATGEAEGVTRDARTPIIVPAGKPVVVGISAPLTGPDSVVGAEDRDSALVGIMRWKKVNGDQIKGHDIEVRAEDDGCTEADITVEAAERLSRQEGLTGVIGPDCSAGAQAAIPIYASSGITAISGSATQSDLTTTQPEGGFFFRTAYRNDLEGILAGLFTGQVLGAKRVALVDDGEPYGVDLADSAQDVMEATGIEVTRESIQRGTVDFSGLATKIAQDRPDLVGFAGFNPEAALLYRQLRDAGYAGFFGAGDAAWGPPFLEPVGAQAAEGVFFVGCSLSLPEDFVADFESLRGHPPRDSAFSAQYADAATILLDAVAKVAVENGDGSLSIDPQALRDAVRATQLQDGVSGRIAFDEDGDRLPPGTVSLSAFIDLAVKAADLDTFAAELGLVACQVRDGKTVNLTGPGTPSSP